MGLDHRSDAPTRPIEAGLNRSSLEPYPSDSRNAGIKITITSDHLDPVIGAKEIPGIFEVFGMDNLIDAVVCGVVPKRVSVRICNHCEILALKCIAGPFFAGIYV